MENNQRVMHKCYYCGKKAVNWQSDFTYEDYEYIGNGIVKNFSCSYCGAIIEYCIPLDDPDEDGENVGG